MALATDRAPLTGALWALFATVAFTMVDVIVKFLSSDYSHYQVTFLRTLVGVIVLLAVIVPLSGGSYDFRTRRLGWHMTRGVCVVFANLCFFLALAAMPLAEAVAVFFVSPFLIALFSILFLGETVGPRRWAAIAVGMLGVLVVLRPGTAAFQPAALLPILAAAGYGMLHILTRRIGDTESAAVLTFYSMICMLAVAGLAGLLFGAGQFDVFDHPSMAYLFRAWVWPAAFDMALMIGLGVAIAVAGFAISEAYRRSEPAFIAPFEYVALPLSVLWGILVFGEWPDGWALAGIALILASGMVLVWREAVARKSGEVDMPDRI
ncbi:MAG: DMT family transporter [Silicimonas sp.]|jgi:drug/metabolite transporter (DMT)-like permease|nr:DMT family transporter [Silicimonas sp.]